MRSMALCSAAMAVMLVVSAGCQAGGTSQSLEGSTAPVLVPDGVWRDGFEFGAPPGAVDLYQTRWNYSEVDEVSGWQVASSTMYDVVAIADGPGEDVVVEVLRASRGQGCSLVDSRLLVQLCEYETNSYLVRLVQDHILVVDFLNDGGDRAAYNPAAVEARFITAPFELVPIDGDVDDYLITN